MAITTVRNDALTPSTDFGQQGCAQPPQGDGNTDGQRAASRGYSGREPEHPDERPVPSFWKFDDTAGRTVTKPLKAATTITLN
jgi:hypothetical protein